MSKWRVTIEHTDDEGLQSSVTIQDSYEDQRSCPSELMCIAYTLAKALCAFENIGHCIPTVGTKIIESFDHDIRESWNFWEDSK